MKTSSLISSALVVSSALCLSSCDDALEPDPERKNAAISIIEHSPVDLVVHRQEQLKSESRVVEPIAKQNKAKRDVGFGGELSEDVVVNDNQQEEPIVLDFSLNFEQMDLTDRSNIPGGDRQNLLRGIFESEGEASNIEMETHFEGPHNENKEMDTTPNGAGVKFKIDF